VFGIAKPCRHHLGPVLHRQWMSHLCGLCLTLRDDHGQTARATTNVDAVVLSVLVEAQSEHRLTRSEASPCPLRGMRPAIVVEPATTAPRHAAAVSLTMAATKLVDHAADHDGLVGRVPVTARRVGRRWASEGHDTGREVGFDTSILLAAVAESTRREEATGLGFDAWVAPTEDAAAAACRHTAVLAGRPGNVEALDDLGRMFGRLTYLLDAVRDEQDDLRHRRFNALVAAFPHPAERPVSARALFRDAHARLTAAFDRLDLVDGELARAVLVEQLWRVGAHELALDGRRHQACEAHAHRHGDRAHRSRPWRAVAQVGAATVAALGLSLGIFGHDDPAAPGEEGVPGQKRRGLGDDATDSAVDSACDFCDCACCTCCACDSCGDCGDCDCDC